MAKNLPAVRETWVGKMPWRSERLHTPVFWPGEFHGLCSPRGRKESDTPERLALLMILSLTKPHFLLIVILCNFIIRLFQNNNVG